LLLNYSVRMKSTAGSHEFNWISDMSTGVYFYSLESPWRKETGKIVLVK
jgi:hypothetical protein